MSSILIAEYNPRWPELFEREAATIRGALGPRALQVEHTGSTAVPGLAAKPTIDLLLVVANSADEESYRPPLEQAGYVLRLREPEWYEHRLFKGPVTDINLHVLSDGCPEISRILVFRDRLRSYVEDRDLYERAKKDLAQQSWESVDDYANAKSRVIAAIIARAERSD